MLVKLETKALGERLKQLQAVVDSRATISAYTHILLTVANGLATFRANNPTIGMFEATVRAEGDAGSLLLPSKRLAEITPNLVGEAVTFETDGTTDGEGNSNVTVKSGKYKAALRARPASEFPATFDRPEGPIATIGRPAFLDLIEKVAFAVPDNNGKYTVAVGFLDFKPEDIRLVGTDGWSLSVKALPGTVRAPDGTVPASISLPKTALNLLHLLTGGTFTLAETENALFFQTETETFAALKVAGQFPPYERVIPTATPTTTFTVNRDVLSYAIGRARPVADEESPLLAFSIAPTGGETTPLVIRSTSKAAGMANDVIDVKATGVPQEFVLNANFLTPFVEKAGDEILVRIISPNTVVEFVTDNGTYRFFLMPTAAPTAA